MKNLHYTPKDKMLFWVAGYTADGNTGSVTQKVKSLLDNAQIFADKVRCKIEDVQTLYNSFPPRYQYMRVFYVESNGHPDAFVWDGEWTMGKVLTS